MDNFWKNFLVELGLLTLLGVLYYFYQKKKILKFEANKGPILMGMILQSCLVERGEVPDPNLDGLIDALDEYLQNKFPEPPLAMLEVYADKPECSADLREVIREALREYRA